jgi:hypothetical protein
MHQIASKKNYFNILKKTRCSETPVKSMLPEVLKKIFFLCVMKIRSAFLTRKSAINNFNILMLKK